MSEPDWKDALDDWQAEYIQGSHAAREEAWNTLLSHIEAAYQRGLQAGRSQAGYSTRRKSKEGPCPTGTAGAAGSTPASNTEGGEP